MTWPVQKLVLDPPSLEELVSCISSGLRANFRDISVSVVSCPDLRAEPFNLAAAGLCGNERVADIGGPPYLSPVPNKDRKYSLLDMAQLMELNEQKGFVLGAEAGPFHVLGVNSELMPNMAYHESDNSNLTRYAQVADDGGAGDVLKMVAKVRTGGSNFTVAIQAALKGKYRGRTICLGGVFVIKKGKANLHVMPDFSSEPLTTRVATERWLKYFGMSAPLVCLSVFHSHNPGMDLRMEDTHCFSNHGEGGHYHNDITPDEVEYEAYFNTAKVLYRIDQPGEASQINQRRE